jgi:hypothetical protein
MKYWMMPGFRYLNPGALLAVQSAGAIAQVAGGISQQQAAGQEATLQEQQGRIALTESQTNANNAAFQLTQDVQNQKLQFLANGVSLEGSPSEVIASSKKYAQTQVQSILNQGAAQYNLAQEEAAITKSKGNAALIAGIASGVGSEAQGISKAYQSGLFGTTKGT